MNTTYLVQRLNRPWTSEFEKKAEQVFGGGALLLKPEAWKLVQEIFSIDYMGSAEYEFGALPRSLRELAAAQDLVAFEFVLQRDEIRPNPEWTWRSKEARKKVIAEAKAKGKRPPRARKGDYAKHDRPTGPATIYVVCRASQRDGVMASIRSLAKDETRTKGYNGVSDALDPVTDRNSRNCGWYELDNGFFFFTDKTMWERTANLFDVGNPQTQEGAQTAQG